MRRYVIAGNNVTRNVLGGIKLQGSRDNLLYLNDLVENALDGAGVTATSPLVQSLLKSSQDERASNAYDDAKNHWDNGTVGNYYTDFNCTDADGDGICDSERAIPGGESVDRYPLARPNSGG
jgi:parallel beta-helix repeat protein